MFTTVLSVGKRVSIAPIVAKISRLTYPRLMRRLSPRSRSLISSMFMMAVCKLPIWIIVRAPAMIRVLIFTTLKSCSNQARKLEFLENVWGKTSAGPELLELFASNSYFSRGTLPWSDHSASISRNNSKSEHGMGVLELLKMSVWTFWNLNHRDFRLFNSEIISRLNTTLEDLEMDDSVFSERFLPSFATNFGHLSLLFLYINRYRKDSSQRIIRLPSNSKPNPFYFELIKRESPVRIEEFDYKSKTSVKIQHIDDVTYTLGVNRRFESGTSTSFAPLRTHEEFLIESDFQLRLTEEERQRGRRIFTEGVGIAGFEFIVALHVKQSGQGDQLFSQARDCDIQQLRTFCGNIVRNGGLVVRMGSSDFPILDKSFPAFDYAHSKIKSDFMDCWLWSEANFWVGNSSGASLASMTFGKPRVIINQFYVDFVGPSRDMVVPKKIFSGNHQLSLQEIFDTRISRCMNRQEFNSMGLRIEDLNQDELLKLSEIAIHKYVNQGIFQVEEQFDQTEKEYLFKQPSNLLMTTPKLS